MRRDIEHPVHAVDEVHVGVARRAKHGVVAPGGAGRGVARRIFGAAVPFSFDDPSDEGLPIHDAHQPLADEIVGNDLGIACIEAAWKRRHQRFDLRGLLVYLRYGDGLMSRSSERAPRRVGRGRAIATGGTAMSDIPDWLVELAAQRDDNEERMR